MFVRKGEPQWLPVVKNLVVKIRIPHYHLVRLTVQRVVGGSVSITVLSRVNDGVRHGKIGRVILALRIYRSVNRFVVFSAPHLTRKYNRRVTSN